MGTAPKLPVLRVVGESIRDIALNLGGLCRIAWPYYALAAALTLGARLFLGDSWIGELGGGTAGIVLSLGLLACAVRWQRHVVVAEPLRGIAPLDGRVTRYFLWSLALGVICAVPAAGAMLVGLATGAVGRTPEGATPFALGLPGLALLAAGVLAGLYLFVRLGPVLPAASVGQRGVGLRAAWAMTRGQFLPLAGIVVLVALGVFIVGAIAALFEAVFRAAVEAPAGAVTPAGAALDAVLDLLASVLFASVVAHIYRRLMVPPAAA